MSRSMKIRQPAVAGMFYPDDANKLRSEIRALIHQATTERGARNVKGIIAPHAGYVYSGLTAAHAYALLRGEKFETVVVVSPSHHEFFHGVSLYSGDAYRTPLGVLEVNARLRDALLHRTNFIVASDVGHHSEHALEVQLPFLQEVVGEFALLPLVVGNQKPEICFTLGEGLADVLKNENALVVASSDLSHFHSSDVADELDGVMIKDVNEFDFEKLMRDLQTQRTEACGGGPAVAVMAALKRLGVKKMEVVHHSNSGDVSGDYSRVVGYLSAVAYN